MKENLNNTKFVTPVMKQFWEAKSAYPDSIMLFRMGDFYETFDEDAKIAAKVLGIALTKRANGAASSVPLAGFPFHSLDQYLYKLLSDGYKVAICEQVEDPKLAKGIVKREVVEVLSPGTAIAEKYLNSNENNYLLSIFFKNNAIGYSLLDYSTGEFLVGQCSLNYLNNILKKYNIKEIIISKNQTSYLDNIDLNNVLVSTYNNWISNYQSCYDKLLDHFHVKSLKGFGIEKEKLSIVSAGASIIYVEENYFGKIKHITSLSRINNDNYMRIDSSTFKNLEIFESLSSKDTKGTLIDVIDNTVTPMGGRLLKQHLMHPLSIKKDISYRLNIVNEFVNNIKIESVLNEQLKSISDIHRILSKISTNKSNPKDLVDLSISLKSINAIKKIINNSKKIKKLISKSKNVKSICNKIDKNIIDSPPINLSKGGFIKNGISKKLDELRLISNNANQWLVDYQLSQKEVTGITSLKIGYNKVFGYYIDITKTHLDKVPDNYIRKQTLTNSERYFTEELKEYEEKILSSFDQILIIEKQIFEKLIKDILDKVKEIQFNANIIGEIDIYFSHAKTAFKNNFYKPIISEKSSKIKLKNSRHPVVEVLLPENEKFITNDLELDNKKKQIAIITGPNMAGKSTFLRQIGLIAILCQIGSFVPSEKSEISIIDQLFTRVGASDNLVGGESTFLVEMNEAANILNNATSKSLIILDEIGRGTSTFDGLSLAWSITEYLHNNKLIKAKTLFATHYHELIALADELKDAFNLNIGVEEYDDEIIFLRKIKKGGANKSYGINVAKMAGLPAYVTKRANKLLLQFTNQKNELQNESIVLQEEIFNNSEHIIDELKNIDLDTLSPLDALNKLNNLKKQLES